MIVQKYGTMSGQRSQNALLSDIHQSSTHGDAPGAGPQEMECTNEYDDTEVSATFCSIAFCASTPPGRGIGNVEIAIPLVYGQIIRRTVHALYTPCRRALHNALAASLVTARSSPTGL
jgi:hypothetical protein